MPPSQLLSVTVSLSTLEVCRDLTHHWAYKVSAVETKVGGRQGREVVRWGERQAYGCICVGQSGQWE